MSPGKTSEVGSTLYKLLLQHLQEVLAELRYLWRNHRHAIRLILVIGKVFLMVILSHEELIELVTSVTIGLSEIFCIPAPDELLGDLLLLVIMIEDRRAVLRTDVGALTVQRGWIVDGEEDIQQVPIGDDIRVKMDLHDFGVPRVTVTNFAVGGLLM